MIDLALSYERNRAKQTGTRPPTMYTVLCSAQQELDDIRHVLHQWYNAGMPGDGEPVEQRAPTLEKVHDDNELAERRKAARIADEAIFYGAIFEKLTHAGAVADLLRTTKENEPFENTFKQTDDLLCCQISSAIKDLEDWYEQTPGAAQP